MAHCAQRHLIEAAADAEPAPLASSRRPTGPPQTPATTLDLKGGPGPGVLQIVTLGCRLNAFESEVMRQNANAAGLKNAAIVNTCAVTGEAVRQAAQTIRRLRREQPSTRIIVTGCAAQTEPGRFSAMPEVDAVIGNAEKMALGTFQALSLG